MTRRCLATHPAGGDFPPSCSADHGHDGPHIAAWEPVFSLSGRVAAGGETWDDPAQGHETHATGSRSDAGPHPGSRSHCEAKPPKWNDPTNGEPK